MCMNKQNTLLGPFECSKVLFISLISFNDKDIHWSQTRKNHYFTVLPGVEDDI